MVVKMVEVTVRNIKHARYLTMQPSNITSQISTVGFVGDMHTHTWSTRVRKRNTRQTLPWQAEWVGPTPSVKVDLRGTLINLD